jgi:hypothetical protein
VEGWLFLYHIINGDRCLYSTINKENNNFGVTPSPMTAYFVVLKRVCTAATRVGFQTGYLAMATPPKLNVPNSTFDDVCFI